MDASTPRPRVAGDARPSVLQRFYSTRSLIDRRRVMYSIPPGYTQARNRECPEVTDLAVVSGELGVKLAGRGPGFRYRVPRYRHGARWRDARRMTLMIDTAAAAALSLVADRRCALGGGAPITVGADG